MSGILGALPWQKPSGERTKALRRGAPLPPPIPPRPRPPVAGGVTVLGSDRGPELRPPGRIQSQPPLW
jgi:hypothetical protein